jgi:hypothetical protein
MEASADSQQDQKPLFDAYSDVYLMPFMASELIGIYLPTWSKFEQRLGKRASLSADPDK